MITDGDRVVDMSLSLRSSVTWSCRLYRYVSLLFCAQRNITGEETHSRYMYNGCAVVMSAW